MFDRAVQLNRKLFDRGREPGYPGPPAQNRTGGRVGRRRVASLAVSQRPLPKPDMSFLISSSFPVPCPLAPPGSIPMDILVTEKYVNTRRADAGVRPIGVMGDHG